MSQEQLPIPPGEYTGEILEVDFRVTERASWIGFRLGLYEDGQLWVYFIGNTDTMAYVKATLKPKSRVTVEVNHKEIEGKTYYTTRTKWDTLQSP